MQNELLWLAMLLANFFLIILAYKLFGKWGLIMWIPISVIVANIQVIQTIELFMIQDLQLDAPGQETAKKIFRQAVSVKDIVSQDQGDGIGADEMLPDEEGLGQPFRSGLGNVVEGDAPLGAVPQKVAEKF